MDGFDLIAVGWISILPPIIAIVLALLTKEVFSSLLIGLLSGTLIYAFNTGGNVLTAILDMFRVMADRIGANGFMIIFLALLGSLVVVVTMAGGSRAYGKWAAKGIKTQKGAKLATSVLGMIIFIDDYFNCLTVGTVMRPLTDQHKISREKLAYIIDATAAPICIIAPISSWAAAVASNLGEGGFNAFMQTIPYNLYALLTIAMVLVLCCTKIDFGAMRKAQLAREQSELSDEEVEGQDFDNIKTSKKGRVTDLLVPIIVLIACSILGMAYVGGFFEGVDFVEAVGADPTVGLTLGAFAALITALVMYLPRKLMSFRDFMGGFVQGVKSMIPAILILIFAWSLSGVCRYMIGTGEFVSQAVAASNFPLQFLPVIIFLVAAGLSFSMGTAWGTFGILLPIVMMICGGDFTNAYIVPSMAATLAGSVFGDHCSPISDTTSLSSTGAKCDHIKHVSTQIPYALLVAVICAIGYLIAGFANNPWLPLGVSMAILFVVLAVIGKRNKKLDLQKN